MSRLSRTLKRSLALLALLPLLGLAGIECVYRYGLHRVGELPHPPPAPAPGLARTALWLAEDGPVLQFEPLRPWHFVAMFRSPGRASLPAGARIAMLWAQRQLAARGPRAGEGRMQRLLQELALATWVSRRWTSEQLITAYGDTAFFGHGAFGLREAAQRYFGKMPEQLTPAEAALLAGIVRNPSGASPLCRPAAACTRRSHVLALLEQAGRISPEMHMEAERAPLLPPEIAAEGHACLARHGGLPSGTWR